MSENQRQQRVKNVHLSCHLRKTRAKSSLNRKILQQDDSWLTKRHNQLEARNVIVIPPSGFSPGQTGQLKLFANPVKHVKYCIETCDIARNNEAYDENHYDDHKPNQNKKGNISLRFFLGWLLLFFSICLHLILLQRLFRVARLRLLDRLLNIAYLRLLNWRLNWRLYRWLNWWLCYLITHGCLLFSLNELQYEVVPQKTAK